TLFHSGVRGRQVALPSACSLAGYHQNFFTSSGSSNTLLRVGGAPASAACFITSLLVANWMKSNAAALFLESFEIATSQLPSCEVWRSPLGKGMTAILPDTFDLDGSSIWTLNAGQTIALIVEPLSIAAPTSSALKFTAPGGAISSSPT